MEIINIWKFLAGLGLFLYGMNLMEHVLKKISGRSFKLFLEKYTQNLFKAIVGGTLVTGLLQSSSVVSLLVLAFVGAGIITFRNALGIILGSNLGTTLSSWIVATVGFKLSIENYALPVVAISALGMFFFHHRKRLYNLLRLFFSIGLLFLGLSFMKSGGENIVSHLELSSLAQYNTLVFLLIGFAITFIIQSSSATIAITLTALHTHAITFPSAAAIVIGSELGTTIKILLAASNGSPDKKRVAWGNFAFNAITTLFAYLTLPWLLYFIQEILFVHDPLIGLVFFQSGINLLAIILFLPVINPFAKWLEKRFKNETHVETSFISRDFPVVAALVMEALFQETTLLVTRTAKFIKQIVGISNQSPEGFLKSLTPEIKTENQYDQLKKIEGEILRYCALLPPEDLDKEQHNTINQYITAVRYSVHAAKSMKDIQHNLYDLSNSSHDVLHEQYLGLQKDWTRFDSSFERLLALTDTNLLFEELSALMKSTFNAQQQSHVKIIDALKQRLLTEIEASTLMNVHREVLSAKKSLLRALSHLKLTSAQADAFEFLPE